MRQKDRAATRLQPRRLPFASFASSAKKCLDHARAVPHASHRASHRTFFGSPAPHCARAHDDARFDPRQPATLLHSRENKKPLWGGCARACTRTQSLSDGAEAGNHPYRRRGRADPVDADRGAVSHAQRAARKVRSRKRLIVVLRSTTSRLNIMPRCALPLGNAYKVSTVGTGTVPTGVVVRGRKIGKEV